MHPGNIWTKRVNAHGRRDAFRDFEQTRIIRSFKQKPVAYSLLAPNDKYLHDGRKTQLKPVKQHKYVLLLLATVSGHAMKITFWVRIKLSGTRTVIDPPGLCWYHWRAWNSKYENVKVAELIGFHRCSFINLHSVFQPCWHASLQSRIYKYKI